MNNPLLDYEFLNDLMNYRQRDIYARITLLTQDELPIEYIEGRVTGGSINVDGNSALRRTCNLTMVLKNQDEINQFNWTFKSKFKLEIGIKNTINDIYPNIIWFKQGIFILTTCNMSQTTNNYTITINGKDKMCLLNGDIGGVIPHSTNFGIEEYYDIDTDTVIYNNVLIKDIIYNSVRVFGGESPENIIINDLDDAGFELLEYKYEEGPLYLFRSVTDNEVYQATLNSDHPVYIDGEETSTPVSKEEKIIYVKTSELQNSGENPTVVTLKPDEGEEEAERYNIIRLEYGDLAGYRLTDLVYAGELISNIGDSLTSVLDKIKQMLGNFEYFYNIDGKFVFQKKRSYISTPWTAVETDKKDIINFAINDSYPKINLMNAELTTSFANNPNLLNVKNDFSVWGTYKSLSGNDIPIHMRYALDTKPTQYKAIRSLWTRKQGTAAKEPKDYTYFKDKLKHTGPDEKGMISSYFDDQYCFIASDNPQDKMEVDWREIIYQMALDYYALNKEDDFYLNVAKANPQYPTGRTGYEQYYADMQGFWRQLYDPYPEDGYIEISATTVNNLKATPDDPYNRDTDLFVDSYYAPIKKTDYYINESNNKIFDENGEIKSDWPYRIEDLYVIMENTVKTSDGKSFDKITFYPFVGSVYCHLLPANKNKDYWYYNGLKYIKTKDEEILNVRTLQNIYEDVGNDKKESVVNISFKDFVKNKWNDTTVKLWVKQEGKILFKNLDQQCQRIYRGGTEDWESRAFEQHLVNWAIKDNYGNLSNTQETKDRIIYVRRYANGDYNQNHWNKAIKDDPGTLYFWFDFLDVEDSQLCKYSVKQIGVRTKSINDTNVKSIYYREVPNVLFIQNLSDKKYDSQPGYTYIQLPIGYSSLFSISNKGKSAKEEIDELLENHSYVIEQTNITTIPLYHLEPNTRIMIRDDKSKIDGEYIVSKITIPLAYNGTMNLTATKVISSIM